MFTALPLSVCIRRLSRHKIIVYIPQCGYIIHSSCQVRYPHLKSDRGNRCLKLPEISSFRKSHPNRHFRTHYYIGPGHMVMVENIQRPGRIKCPPKTLERSTETCLIAQNQNNAPIVPLFGTHWLCYSQEL